MLMYVSPLRPASTRGMGDAAHHQLLKLDLWKLHLAHRLEERRLRQPRGRGERQFVSLRRPRSTSASNGELLSEWELL